MSLTLNEKFRDYIANAGGVTPDQLADCSYYTIQELNNTFRDPNLEKNLINVFHVNIRSLNANHNKLLELMITLNYSFYVIVLTEIFFLVYRCIAIYYRDTVLFMIISSYGNKYWRSRYLYP